MAIHQILRRQCPALLELGGRVREMRRAAGLTQAAAAAPFSAAYISAIEHGIVVPFTLRARRPRLTAGRGTGGTPRRSQLPCASRVH